MNTKINKLKLYNFRNYESCNIDAGRGIVALYGQNGVGKTNILEAISLLVPGRGIRNAKLTDLQKFSEINVQNTDSTMPWSVFSSLDTIDGQTSIGTSIERNSTNSDKRIVKINGDYVKNQSDLIDYLSIFWLLPSQDQIFASGITSRREFLDNICVQFFKGYGTQQSEYENLKKQRRMILYKTSYDQDWLSTIEKQMSEKAISIASYRLQLVELLNKTANSIDKFGFPEVEVDVSGDVENLLKQEKASDVENKFSEMLEKNRHTDAESGRTSKGIHKSDFRVKHLQKNISAEFCSQGEQKACLLSIILYSALAKKNYSKITPILLLDEVTAHLDQEKRKYLFDLLNSINCQTWLTGTEKDHFDDVDEIQLIEIK